MAYIGNQPAESFTSFATQEFSTSATTSYTLDHAVTNENEIALFVNNVRQQPGSGKAYTATGTALTLSAATASTDTMYCVFLGRALQTVTPATNSINNAMVSSTAAIATTKLGAGAILQVVQTYKTDVFSTTSESLVDITGMTASITPSSTSNKVLVFLNLAVGSSTTLSRTMIQLMRDSTNIGIGDAGGGNRTRSISTEFQPSPYNTAGSKNNTDIRQHIFLDTPSSSSSLTYKVQIEGSAQTVYINRTGDFADADIVSTGTSSLTLMEIAG
ncbi:hypothetical protein [uncultured virus]|uniref:Uncharacterized protein n=1 Tax=uncultured virus TaxID=340016 RepID=A0A218MLU5_9VIRU|nr:hypothetical protein [uncultured virus]